MLIGVKCQSMESYSELKQMTSKDHFLYIPRPIIMVLHIAIAAIKQMHSKSNAHVQLHEEHQLYGLIMENSGAER